jgi:ABC-2 type transport system permease protein
MLVAPVTRASIVIGKCLGGATVATIQGMVILCLAGLVGVPYSPTLIISLIGEMFLASFALTALGVTVAASMKNMQSFFALQQVALMPMIFLSGILFPLSKLPLWLGLLTRINPVSYVVDALRRTVFAHLAVGHGRGLGRVLNPGVTWWGWRVPVGLELLMVAMLGLVLVTIAISRFSRTE